MFPFRKRKTTESVKGLVRCKDCVFCVEDQPWHKFFTEEGVELISKTSGVPSNEFGCNCKDNAEIKKEWDSLNGHYIRVSYLNVYEANTDGNCEFFNRKDSVKKEETIIVENVKEVV